MADNEFNVKYKFKRGRGRPRKIGTPSQLDSIFFDDYLVVRTGKVIELIETEEGHIGNSDIKKVKTKRKMMPISIEDFCAYIGVSRNWWNELPDEFFGVKSKISTAIFSYQLRGAMIGEFNANIVARQLGLADKKEVSTSGDGITIVVNSKEEKDKLDNLGGLEI